MKRLLSIMLVCFIATASFGALSYKTWTPVNQNGVSIDEDDMVGVYSYRISASSVAVMVTSTTYNNNSGKANPASLQPCIVYGVAFSSKTPSSAASYLILRDTTTPGYGMAEAIIPEIYNGVFAAVGGQYTLMHNFEPPLRCKYGLSACYQDGSNGAPAGDVWIYYRLIGQETDGKRY